MFERSLLDVSSSIPIQSDRDIVVERHTYMCEMTNVNFSMLCHHKDNSIPLNCIEVAAEILEMDSQHSS